MKSVFMECEVDDIWKDASPPSLHAKRYPATHQPTWRCLPKPCPGCGSGMVSSRELRDLCLICGYLQSQA